MKFGYFCNITNWNHKPYTQVIDEIRYIASTAGNWLIL